MAAYYNEIEPYAVEWLRNLIKKGLIADGIVDDRSITNVEASDLGDFTQCHFFAGIGVWSYALRLAGWPDDREVWTGSCPCQPFSAAGKGKGFDDERHLWPEFHRLISECRPPVVFGEQVASKDGLQWLDTVQSDMEASGYAIGAADMCAAGVGAPHIRQRLWFVGERLDDTAGARHFGPLSRTEGEARDEAWVRVPGEGRGPRGLANAHGKDQRGRGVQRPGQGNGAGDGAACERSAGLRADGGLGHHHHQGLEGQRRGHQAEGGWNGAAGSVAEAGEPRGLADADGRDAGAEGLQRSGQHGQQPQDGGALHGGRPRPTNGHWRDADWLHCRDGKWRPVEARPQPLADGSAESLGRVRAEAGAEIEEALNAAAVEGQVTRSAILRALQKNLGAQARSVWATGRLPGLSEAPFLLAFLRQLQAEGWRIEESGALPRAETEARLMRVLRGDEAPTSPSCGRELEEQRARKSADAVHLLSSLLARHAQASWGHAYETYAEIGFPIGHGSPARVGRLRAYGNAIVPQAAAEVIRAFMEAR